MKIRGLLLKDIFELWAQCRVQLVLTGVYLLLPLFIKGIGLFASVGMMLLAMMPVGTVRARHAGAEERSLLEPVSAGCGRRCARRDSTGDCRPSYRAGRSSLPARRYRAVGCRISSHYASADDEARRGKGPVPSSAADHGVSAAVRGSCVRQTGASVVEFLVSFLYDGSRKFIVSRRSP